ncbi:MAG: AAA family ATPase [Methylobacter sp.]|nr:AAA family ATPase [Methylobacter sp.]
MATFFDSVHITNFKSLKDVTLSDCKRINLLIGKPNVGKSNVLEAIGLFSLPYFRYDKNKKLLTQIVRFENIAELFFDGNIDEKIVIRTNDNSFCIVNYLEQRNLVQFEIDLKPNFPIDESLLENILAQSNLRASDIYEVGINNGLILGLSGGTRPSTGYVGSKVNYYKFSEVFVLKKPDLFSNLTSHLTPPNGVNLLDVIQRNKTLEKELSKLFTEYGLQLLLDKTSHTLRIMKNLKEDNVMVSFPYSSIADTLQRIIFFKTAITSNKNSILLFEEPEAHCFPPYITHIAKEIINSESNQFFIATHSPYILDAFLENARADLAIFMADFKDGQTVIKRLTDNELNDVYEYGLDLFFNSELFTDEL